MININMIKVLIVYTFNHEVNVKIIEWCNIKLQLQFIQKYT